MSDHALGLRLRRILLLDTSPGPAGGPRLAEPLEGRRLQALVGDLCRHDQQDLLPPLRHLVLAPAFQSALRASPPLGDSRSRQRLMAELRPVFTPARCERMEAVLDGLLGLEPRQGAGVVAASADFAGPARTAGTAGFAAPAGPALSPGSRALAGGELAPVGGDGAPARPRLARQGRAGGPIVLMGGLAAALLLGVAAARLWWIDAPPAAEVVPDAAPLAPAAPALPSPDDRGPQAASPGQATPLDPVTGFPQAEVDSSAGVGPSETPTPAPPPLPPLPTGGENAAGQQAMAPAAAGSDPALAAAAIGQVQGLYASLSRQAFTEARGYFSPEAADQFDPAFFRQFTRVEVGELQPIGRSATTLTLQGVVRFVYPDGSSQSESRRFTLSSLEDPPRVIGSAFGAVLRPRSPSP
jgi:hypothetical protein